MSRIEILLCRCLIPYICHEMWQGSFSHSCNSSYLTEIRSIMSPHRDMFTMPLQDATADRKLIMNGVWIGMQDELFPSFRFEIWK